MTTPTVALSPLTLDTLPDAARVPAGRSLVAMRRAVARNQYMYPCEAKRYVALQTDEKTVQEALRAAAKALGWLYYHTHDSRFSAAGFPDTVLVKGPRCLYIEVKREDTKPTAEQLVWLSSLIVAGQSVYILRPSGLTVMIEHLANGAPACQ